MESLDFDKLVTSYYENLNTKLRNFYTGPEFLDSWVHDDNLNRSLFGLFESASDNGVEELEVRVSEGLSKGIDFSTLESDLSEIGTTRVEKSGDVFNIQMRKIHPVYKRALLQRSKNILYEGKLENQTVESRQGRLVLHCKIDSNGIVSGARHEGGFGFFRPLLDILCEVLMNRPIQEGLDHALIRIEALTRDPEMPRPVKGLTTPENSEPAFKVLQELLRKIPCDREPRNEWIDSVSASWKTLSFEEQKEKIETLLPETGLKVIEIRHHTRVVLTGDAFRIKPNAGYEFMALERKAKDQLEPLLEFTLESLEDKNKREQRTGH